MIASLPPAAILILGALLVLLLRGRLRAAYVLALPTLSLLHIVSLFGVDAGSHIQLTLFDTTLTLARIDKLSLIFGYIFHLVAFLSALYALHVKDSVQNVAGTVYAGAAIGAVFAGDMFTLFAFWEMLTISATFLIVIRYFSCLCLHKKFSLWFIYIMGSPFSESICEKQRWVHSPIYQPA